MAIILTGKEIRHAVAELLHRAGVRGGMDDLTAVALAFVPPG